MNTRWLTAAEAAAIDELLAALRDSETRPAGEGRVRLSPRVSRALGAVDAVAGGLQPQHCSGSEQRVWREDTAYYSCETCVQRFGDHELDCDPNGWKLPAHEHYPTGGL